MKLLASVFLLAVLLSCIGRAETNSDNPPLMSFGTFPLPRVRTYVSAAAGIPASKARMDDPSPNDFPPATTVSLEDARDYPATNKGPRYFFPGHNILRVFRISHVESAPYKTIQSDITSLRKLLVDRPQSIPDDDEHSLPDYPPRNSAHAFQVHVAYLDADWGSGICYVTQFSQDGGTPANNEELTYIFQGISKDNNFYVSGDFRITHPKLPKGIDDTPHREKGDYDADRILLSKQSDASFTPSLAKLREWLKSLKIE
jgi:hypothetical protein